MTLFNFRDMYATKFGVPLTARFKHDAKVVEQYTKEVLHQHKDLSVEEATGRALARLDYQEYRRQQAKGLIVTAKHNYRRWALIAFVAALMLAVIGLSAKLAHGQVDAVRVSASGVQKKQWAGGIAKIDFGTGLVVDCVSTPGTCLITATGGVGSGITNLNGLTADPQTFAKVNDTNVTITITSSIGTHTYTMGWTGTLGKSRGGAGADMSSVTFPSSGTIATTADNVATATALAANGTNCGVGNAARGVDASGNAENCFAPTAAPFASTTLTDFSSTAPSADGQIPIWDSAAPSSSGGTGAFVPGDPKVQGLTAHDAAGSSTNPVPIGGYASAAAPTDVSTDVDIVRAWFLKNGAQIFGIQAAGALIGGDAANGLDVDVTRVSGNVAVTVADGANVTLGAKADAKSTATDTTAVTAMQVLKQISASVQAPPSQAVTNAGTFATQAAATEADGANVTLGAKADAKSTATDTTAVTAMQVLKQISASVQAPPSQAVTNAGTFVTQSTLAAETTKVIGTVRTADGAGNLLTTNSTTYTAKFALDGNWLGTLGTAFSTPGKVDVKGADGDVFVRQATASNLNARTDTSGATGAAPPARADFVGFIGSGATGGFTTGAAVGDTYKNINVSTATTTLLVTGVSGRQVRISAMHMITTLANNVALIEGTGATCGTGTAGMAGGTTAASGYNLAANGGIAFGSGLGTVIQTATTGDSVCVVTSAATQLSGGLQYTIY